MKKLLSLALALASTTALAAPAFATVYDVSLQAPAGFVFGTVTTDDTIGSVTSANLTDWTLFVGTNEQNYIALTSGNSSFYAGGTGLVASPDYLTFDFNNGPDISYFGFALNDASDAAICVVTGPATCNGQSNGIYAGVGDQFVFYPETGVQAFATAAAAVPETATWGMMIAGFGMIGAAARRRKTVTKVSFA